METIREIWSDWNDFSFLVSTVSRFESEGWPNLENYNIEGMARLTIEPSYTKPASLNNNMIQVPVFVFLVASESPPKNCTLLYIFKTNFEIFEA